MSRWRGWAAIGSTVFLLGALAAGIPPIVAAAKDAEWPAVRALIDAGADVNATYGDGTSALHWASYWDDAETARLLLDAGADPNTVTDLGVTPLWPAAENGSAAMARLLLEAGADPGAALLSGETLVMTAARTGNADVARQLLAAGADPNGSATRGQTALMWAGGQGHAEVVGVLLEYGADVHARTEVRTQYMKTDKGQESHPAYQTWVEQGGNTPLIFAARSGDLPSAELLVDAGSDVNGLAAFGTSPTIMAVHGGNADLVELLLARGADPNSAAAGHTALHVAVLRGDDDSVRTLLVYGADPNAQVERATPTRRQSLDYHFHETFVGATPLWLAARFAEPEAMRALLDHGADPRFVHSVSYPTGNRERHQIEDEGNVSVLMAALGMGNRRITRSTGPDRRGAAEGSIPVYQLPPDARETLALEAVRIAVEAGAELDIANAYGQTALDTAMELEFDSIVAYLVESGAEVPF